MTSGWKGENAQANRGHLNQPIGQLYSYIKQEISASRLARDEKIHSPTFGRNAIATRRHTRQRTRSYRRIIYKFAMDETIDCPINPSHKMNLKDKEHITECARAVRAMVLVTFLLKFHQLLLGKRRAVSLWHLRWFTSPRMSIGYTLPGTWLRISCNITGLNFSRPMLKLRFLLQWEGCSNQLVYVKFFLHILTMAWTITNLLVYA
jgi:hypothetical protein